MRALIAGVTAALLVSGCGAAGPADSPSTSGTQTAAAPDDHRLQGTYRMFVDFTNRLENGLPVPREPRNAVYAFRTSCSEDAVCVATTVELDLADPSRVAEGGLRTVLDYRDGLWQTTNEVTITCAEQDVPALESWTLQRRDDGTFAGTYRLGVTTEGCGAAVEAPMTVTRLGETDEQVQFADPAQEDPLIPSAGAGFTGRYRSTTTDPASGSQQSQERRATTTCIRNTERCLAFLGHVGDTAVTVEAYELDGETWTSRRMAVAKCPTGAEITASARNELAMPNPLTTPIAELRGTHEVVYPDTCPAAAAFTLFFQRLGD